MNGLHYDRTDDDQRNIIDDVRIYLQPRYKTSELSGDEWRVSAVLELRRKGAVMVREIFATVDAAVAKLPWLLLTWCETAGEEWTDRIQADESTCHQAGCSEPATVVYRKRRDYCREGHASEISGVSRRAFCARHSRRGDCGLDDADENYELVSGEAVAPTAGDVAPSVFGGIIREKVTPCGTPTPGACNDKMDGCYCTLAPGHDGHHADERVRGCWDHVAGTGAKSDTKVKP